MSSVMNKVVLESRSVLNFESLTPEEKEQLAKMNPDIAGWLEEEKTEREEILSHVWSIEKYNHRREELRKEYHDLSESYISSNQGD